MNKPNETPFIPSEEAMQQLQEGMYSSLYVNEVSTDRTFYLFGFIKLETFHNITQDEAKNMLRPYIRPFVKIRVMKLNNPKNFLLGKWYSFVAWWSLYIEKDEKKHDKYLDKAIYKECGDLL